MARFRCGLDGSFRFNRDDDPQNPSLALKGKWWSPTLLEIERQYPDSGRSTYMTFRFEFKGEDLTVHFADNEYFSGTIHSLAKAEKSSPGSVKVPESSVTGLPSTQ